MTRALGLLPVALGVLVGFAQTSQEAHLLEPGRSVERELAGGETHTYRFTLTAGQSLRILVEQKGIDVALVLMEPSGQVGGEVDLTRTSGLESLSAEASSGDYRLTIRASGAATIAGAYQVTLEVRAALAAQDRQRIAAERLLSEANLLRGQRLGQAAEKWEQALALWRALKDRYWEVFTLNQLGSAYSRLSHHETALKYFEQALAISRATKGREGEASSLLGLSNVHYFWGRFEKQIEYCEQALTVYRAMKNRNGEASALGNLGLAYASLNRYEKAIESYEQALAIFRELKNRAEEGRALHNLSLAYQMLGRQDKAIEYLEQSLHIRREVKDRRGEGVTLDAMGTAYADLGRYDEASAYLEQALAIAREVKNRQGQGVSLSNLGFVYNKLGRYEKATETSELALAIAREVKARANEFHPLQTLGEIHRAQGRYEEATRLHEQALSVAREIKTRGREASALNQLMLDWRARNQPRPAVFFGKQSVNTYQEIRSEIRSLDRESQQSYVKSKEDTYRTLADLLIAEGRLPEAEQVIRLLKQEEYFDFIRRDQSAAPQAEKARLTPEEAALEKRYREVSDRLADLGLERGTLINKTERTAEEEQRLAQLDADLAVAGQAFQKFLSGLETELSSAREASARVYSLREAQGLMEDLRELGAGVVALHTLVGEDKYRVILTTPDFQKGFESPIKAADLNRRVLEFRELLQNPKFDPLPLAQELYRLLLGPAAKDLAASKAQTLMWSLDGALRYLPLAALHDGRQYLVEQYRNVVFTPASQARLKDVPRNRWRALGLGVTKAHGERIPALPGVAEEMRGIIRDDSTGSSSGVLPGTIKLDEAFTQAAMLAGLRQRPPVVHVASHFQFQPGNETSSALLLGDGNFLSLAEIKSLPNVFGGVELLTLSACNTATGGTEANGKEVEGFGVLAQRQGAKAVVASLWPVADRSTKVLMQEFYRLREARSGMRKAEALRQAQLKLLQGEPDAEIVGAPGSRKIVHEEETSSAADKPLFRPDPKRPFIHPYYWAPFILIGNWK